MRHSRNANFCTQFCAIVLISAGFLGGCQPKKGASDVKYAVNQSPSKEEEAKALLGPIAFRVNLTTNRITYFKSGKQIGQWNVVTADTSGEFHSGQIQATPTGIFRADALEACPSWYPAHPTGDDGKPVTDEAQRWKIFETKREIYGPCGEKNPLGKYAIWFNGPYALHGNAAEWVLELPTADERRASGGCVRNPNEKIKFVFREILGTFPELKEYAQKVAAQELAGSNKQTLEKDVTAIPITVVVGKWPTDPKQDAASGTEFDPKPPVAQPTPATVATPAMPANPATPPQPASNCSRVKVTGGSDKEFSAFSRPIDSIDYSIGSLNWGSVLEVKGKAGGFVETSGELFGERSIFVKESSVKCL